MADAFEGALKAAAEKLAEERIPGIEQIRARILERGKPTAELGKAIFLANLLGLNIEASPR